MITQRRSWSAAYVGTPYLDRGRGRAGCDCWGLACLVFKKELEIELTSYVADYASADEQAEIAALIDGRLQVENWIPVPPGHRQPFDLLLFRRGRWASHVGIQEGPDHMLHMDGQDAAKVVRLSDPRFIRREVSAWRHPVIEGGVKCL